MLASERAWLDGTVERDRAEARTRDAIDNSSNDPESYESADW